MSTNDTIRVQFRNVLDNSILVSDVVPTSYQINLDFFSECDFSIAFEDDRADQLYNIVSSGDKACFYCNDRLVMTGYVETFGMTYSRGGGKHLNIHGRDTLGILDDSSIYPNLGQGIKGFHFLPTDKLHYVLKTIFNSAPYIKSSNDTVNDPNNGIQIAKDVAALTAATGFGIGIKQKGKSGRGLSKSFQKNLDRLLTPEKGESYLGYAKRICTRAGCQINMLPGTDDQLLISPPIYDRESSPPFSLVHYGKSSLKNNVISGSVRTNYRSQPSVIIVEATHGQDTFKQTTQKVVIINEFTGYERKPNEKLSLANAIPSVKDAIDQLTSGTNGYVLLAPNQKLYDAIPARVADARTYVSRPWYRVDYNAQTLDEATFYASELMAHAQDNFLEMSYEVAGHSQNGIVFAPNLMIKVYDEAFSESKPIDNNFWIRKVMFSRDRGSNAITHLHLNIPYAHDYEVS